MCLIGVIDVFQYEEELLCVSWKQPSVLIWPD